MKPSPAALAECCVTCTVTLPRDSARVGQLDLEGEGAQKLEVQDSVEENGSKENTGPRVESRAHAWNWILSDTLGLRS